MVPAVAMQSRAAINWRSIAAREKRNEEGGMSKGGEGKERSTYALIQKHLGG